MENYYAQQAGCGIVPYEGVHWQKGHGFFSNFLKGRLLPILKSVLPYLGRTALDTGVSLAKNINEGNNFKEAAKKTFKKKAFDVMDDALVHVKKQSGLGMRRRRRRTRASKQQKLSLTCIAKKRGTKKKKKPAIKRKRRSRRRSQKLQPLF